MSIGSSPTRAKASAPLDTCPAKSSESSLSIISPRICARSRLLSATRTRRRVVAAVTGLPRTHPKHRLPIEPVHAAPPPSPQGRGLRREPGKSRPSLTGPGKPAAEQRMMFQDWIRRARELGASDLHVEGDGPLVIRVRGKLQPVGETSSAADVQRAAEQILGADGWA